MTKYERSTALAKRAELVIPGGHHLSGRPLVDTVTTPMYFEHGNGAYLTDVDGHCYVDWLMAFGPYLLGYARPEVEAAAAEQAAHGRLLSLNHPLHVTFIETLLPLFPGAEMGCFFRNGSEATTAALRIARRATGRRRVARCGYHGWHDWCLPTEAFVPSELHHQVLEYNANVPSTLAELCSNFPSEIAAVTLAPEMVLPLSAEKIKEVASLARSNNAVFIMDEVKTAFRSPQRSICQFLDIKPDLITISKAMGNGWPVAALLGSREVMQHGSGMHLSGTFHGDVSAMAAALRAISLIESEAAAAHAQAIGRGLISGLRALGQSHGIALEAYPEPIDAMPFMRFVHEDPSVKKLITDTFYREVLRRGVLLHPRHLWFPSLAHTAVDLEKTLEAADFGMRAVAVVLDANTQAAPG